jgi:hypothetical protein
MDACQSKTHGRFIELSIACQDPTEQRPDVGQTDASPDEQRLNQGKV